ncbi:cyanophycinase [Anatilimnocola floriformis]|uniref:cyanophycinase n=1 Tax=Anatilimnocola floriformis TaxID=2948575 RepID=UPI0020C5B294|nr:Type 1 glutamine amidotransferase-like domain-containing protein [Anatilimnocola floriformis]
MTNLLNRAGLVVVLLIRAISGSESRAQDLLGMPTPIDAQQPGSVVLHGGGAITGDVFNRFVELAGGRNARIVFIPCAGFRREAYDTDEEFLAALNSRYSSWPALVKQGWARSFQFLYTDDPADADDVAFCKPLETATAVWFSGGWQSRLNYRFVGNYPQQTRFQKLLRNVLERGGVVGGTSAGMAAVPEVITMWDERETADAPATARAAHGLGLLTKAIVEQHFDAKSGRLERFTGLLRNNAQLDELTGRRGAGEQMIGLAVEERTALVARGNQLQVLGSGSAHVFVKSRLGRTTSWTELTPGETAWLTRNARNATNIVYEEVAVAR